MGICPYKDGYNCPWYSYGFTSCRNPDKKCLERGKKVLDKRQEQCYNKGTVKERGLIK